MKIVRTFILLGSVQLALSGCSSSGGDDASYEPEAATTEESTTDATTTDATTTEGDQDTLAQPMVLADGTSFEDTGAVSVGCDGSGGFPYRGASVFFYQVRDRDACTGELLPDG